MNIKEETIEAYALKNAIEHEGKAQAGAVLSPLFAEGLKKEEIKEIMPKINEILKKINSLSLEKQKSLFSKYENKVKHRKTRAEDELPELPGAEKGVVMRFRPAPSGPMHVGHLISNLFNSLYVKKYGGKLYVIIDDTDPETTLKESYENLKKDCDWAFGNVSEYLNSSDRMDLYYKYIEKLIEKDKAYVCECSQEDFKNKYSDKAKDCPCRKNSIKENQEKWEKMLDKGKAGYKESEAVLRFKSGMQEKNPAMRDFPLARINLTKHVRQGDKYKVWPLMNLVVSIDDIELGMTHIIRGKDHKDNAKRQEMIFSVFKKKYPWTSFIGRLKFTDLILSKRKLTEAIAAGEFEGTDDTRIPTVASLRKRGFKPEAFKKFVTQRGLSEVDKTMDSKEFFRLIELYSKE
jgi:glutamyl-tRNA synthetase